jgi:hypothetical protein
MAQGGSAKGLARMARGISGRSLAAGIGLQKGEERKRLKTRHKEHQQDCAK